MARLALRGHTADTVKFVLLFDPLSSSGLTRGDAVIITVQTTKVRQQSPKNRKYLNWRLCKFRKL